MYAQQYLSRPAVLSVSIRFRNVLRTQPLIADRPRHALRPGRPVHGAHFALRFNLRFVALG